MDTNEILARYSYTGMNQKECITIQVAHEKQASNEAILGMRLKDVKSLMPNLLKSGYIDLNHLTYCGAIRLTKLGAILAKQANNAPLYTNIAGINYELHSTYAGKRTATIEANKIAKLGKCSVVVEFCSLSVVYVECKNNS